MSRRTIRRDVFDCGDGAHQVINVVTGDSRRFAHRAKPCEQCPWRADLPTGVFPASAFRHSANTARDMAETMFACHVQGAAKPATCAGFLLRGADHNLNVRLAAAQGRYNWHAVSDGGFPLYRSYRDMAEANGVDPDDPALALCRSNLAEAGGLQRRGRKR